MSSKRISKDFDLAAGFFTAIPEEDPQDLTVEKESGEVFEKVNVISKAIKHPGGRPKKEGLKNEQFSVTLNPETYEKIKILANEYSDGNFSRLIVDAIDVFCKKKDIDLSQIIVDPEILSAYLEKQNRRVKK